MSSGKDSKTRSECLDVAAPLQEQKPHWEEHTVRVSEEAGLSPQLERLNSLPVQEYKSAKQAWNGV